MIFVDNFSLKLISVAKLKQALQVGPNLGQLAINEAVKNLLASCLLHVCL